MHAGSSPQVAASTASATWQPEVTMMRMMVWMLRIRISLAEVGAVDGGHVLVVAVDQLRPELARVGPVEHGWNRLEGHLADGLLALRARDGKPHREDGRLPAAAPPALKQVAERDPRGPV